MINDGVADDANGATTLTITVADLNDQAPAFTSSDAVDVAEGATAVVTLAATDTDTADSGGLDYAIVTDDPATGTQFSLSGTSLTIAAQDYETPGCGAGADSRTCTVIVSATDDAGTATQQTITVTITDTNDQTPTFSATAGSINYAEMATSAVDSFTITDTDTTGTLACAESGADAALLSCSISGTTLTVSWDASPDFETKADSGANGVYDYTITVSDGTNDASAVSYAITVTNVNEAPTVANAISDASHAEDAAYSLDTSNVFTDVDAGDSCAYTMSGAPGTLSIGASSGEITGTPINANVGQHTIQVTCEDDSGLSVADTYVLTITNTNDAPTASAGSDQTPTEGATVTLDASGSSDDDGDSMTYSWSQDSGTSMTLSDATSATPTFTAPEATANYVLVFTVTVSDSSSSGTDSVTITVSADNDAPSIDSTAVTSATEDAAYSYTVLLSDPEGQTVTVSCTTCPSWLSYSSSTGKLTGTPDNDDVGANSVVLSATDQTTTVTQSFTVTVANVNSIGSVSLSGTTAEDSVLTATVSDPDGMTGVTVTYQWQRTTTPATASSWSSISGATSSTYTLTQSDVGNYMRVTVSYTDAQGGSESHTGMMGTSISNVNDANTGVPTMSGTFTENQVVTADASPLTGNDEDGMTGSSYTYQWQSCTSTCPHLHVRIFQVQHQPNIQ